MSAREVALGYWLARDAGACAWALRANKSTVTRTANNRLRALLASGARAPYHEARMLNAGFGPGRAGDMSDAELMASLQSLAPTTKEELRDAGDSALNGARVSERWYSSRSSGSSGEPFRVYYSARAWATLKYLVKLRSRRASGVRGDDRIAILDAIAPDQEGHTLLERMGRVRRISVFRAPGEIAQLLADFDPAAIYALPSAMLEVARAIESGAPASRARTIFTSGELLSGAARQSIATAFDAGVRDIYGTSETKEIAWECEAGSRHINADVVHVEILDDGDQPVPAGVEGDIIVTLLVNDAMPLIRYRTGDRGTLLAHTCTCGRQSPLMGVVSGRLADVLELADGTTISPYLLTSTLETVPGLVQYQVTQVERDVIRVNAVNQRGENEETLASDIRAALAHVLPYDVARIEVAFVDRIAPGARAKIRVVQPLPRAGAIGLML